MSKDVILGFGAMRLPLTDKNNDSKVNDEEFSKMIDYYMNQGYNYFDTSYAYHQEKSEEHLRTQLVERYPRESFKIADKMPTWLLTGPEDNERLVNVMLERLGITYFDVFLIHNINSAFLPLAEKAETFQYIAKMKEEGTAKKVGISYHDKSDLLEQILEKYGDILDVVQLQLNYLDWESNLTEARKNYELCEKYGLDVIVMEPVKGGTLAKLPDNIEQEFKEYNNEYTLPQWALRFAGTPKNVKIVLSGMNNFQQTKDNCEVFKDFKPINDEEHEFLQKIADEINKLIPIPCSYCGYCKKQCPKEIPIPDYFELYNNQSLYKLESISAIYGTTSAVNTPASGCIECGNCLDICPQKINIPEELKKVAEEFGQ